MQLEKGKERAGNEARHIAREMRLLFLLLGISLLAPCKIQAQSDNDSGRVQGTVFVSDSTGQSYVADATVTLKGPITLETKTSPDGKYSFGDVPSGMYTIQAKAPGLEATQVVIVETGAVSEVPLELNLAAVQESVVVTSSPIETLTSSPSVEITSRTLQNAPTRNDQTESLLPMIPGVVRGPDGRINMKGARNTQSGSLVNSTNVTDPATGSPGLDVPIDVVASVQVISNPYDPQYGKLTGAVATLDTKTSDFDNWHISVHNFLPRIRVRDDTVDGIGAATPRFTFTGPLWADHIAFTQSFEYRFVRTPVNSLPPFERDTTLQSVNSYSQLDFNLSSKQTATISLSIYPQKLEYLGLNTFTPQPSTSDYHQRGYQLYGQHRLLTGKTSLLISQFSYKKFDADITPAGSGPYTMLIETTEGGFFNTQTRRASRFDWEETYLFGPRHFLGQHDWRVGLKYAHSTYSGYQTFSPVELAGANGLPIEQITFTGGSRASISQHEVAWFAADHWTVFPRLQFDLGLRIDGDTLSSSAHAAPRFGFQLALTASRRTMLRGGVGEFYDRIPLMIPAFESLPNRTVSLLGPAEQVISSINYTNEFVGELRNPRSTAWNLALSQKFSSGLDLEVGYEQRNTANDFIVSTTAGPGPALVTVSNGGGQSYRELQVSGRYHFHEQMIRAAYVHSRAYGDLNDFFQFFGNVSKAVVQPNAQGRLPFDAPNRFLFWGEFNLKWKLTIIPVYDLHTGFPYSVQDEFREYVGPRNKRRFPEFSSCDLQVNRPISIPVGNDKRLRARAGFGVFNIFNHFNPRDVQTIEESSRFGGFFNNSWREYRGRFSLEF